MNLELFQRKLGYQFKDLSLLKQALTHRSHSSAHNERLEFLGDSILNFVVADLLCRQHTQISEGDLSRIRASLVNQTALARIAQTLGVSDQLRLGEGELKSGGFKRPSILADAMEAIFAAIYCDGGMEQVQSIISGLYQPIIETLDPRTAGKDHKTLLQEVLQKNRQDLPIYEIKDTVGEAHRQTFIVECQIPKLKIRTEASGSSRRQAEQEAARLALQKMGLETGS